jgi:hypothetical protein
MSFFFVLSSFFLSATLLSVGLEKLHRDKSHKGPYFSFILVFLAHLYTHYPKHRQATGRGCCHQESSRYLPPPPIHTYIDKHIHMHVYAYIYTCTYIYCYHQESRRYDPTSPLPLSVCLSLSPHTHVCVHTYRHIHTYICTYMIHIHILLPSGEQQEKTLNVFRVYGLGFRVYGLVLSKGHPIASLYGTTRV